MKRSLELNDQRWMRYALGLAAKGLGYVEPNPMVGCVIVQGETLLGQGYHGVFGGPHAERAALADVVATDQLPGATWYVTLEPCCHHGKTPPCTDAVIASGAGRVVIATSDPFAQVARRGIAQLEQAGIVVDVGLCSDQARRLNAAYFKRLKTSTPWVIAKWAMTLDGKIAAHTGDSKWITTTASRQRVHQLRGRCDAIVTGIGTVKADDPLLTARPPGPRNATRIVIDPRGELPADCQLVKTIDQSPVVVFVLSDANPLHVDRLRSLGLQVETSSQPSELVGDLLAWCGAAEMTHVMVEAGGGVMGSFFDADAIDEYYVFIAPKLAGGRLAPSPIAATGLAKIADSPHLEPLQVQSIDGDLLVTTRRVLD